MNAAGIAWEVGQSVAIVAIAFLLVGLTYNLSLIRSRLGPERKPTSLLGVGVPAPALRRADARTNATVDLEDLARQGRPAVVLFLSPTCSACIRHVPGLNALAERSSDVAFVAVVEDGAGFDFAADLSHALRLVVDTDRRLQAAFDVHMFPHVAVVDRDGRLAAQAVSEIEDIPHLLGELRRRAVESRPAREATA